MTSFLSENYLFNQAMRLKMKFIRLIRFFLLLTVLVLVLPLLSHAEKSVTVYTVNYPLAYFAERIGGEHINVVFPAPPDVDPAFWRPDEATVRKYQQADLIILNGADYAKWTKKVSLPMLRTIDTSRSFKNKLLHIETTTTHSHGPGGDHSHGGSAFTTWLDFSQAAQQAEAIMKSLIRKAPEAKQTFADNFATLKTDLLQLDKQLIDITAHSDRQPLIASHPIYQYLARRYNLNLKMMMWEPDTDPGPAEWKELEAQRTNHPAQWMLWEGKPLTGSVNRLKGMGVNSTIFSPCYSRPQKGDFLSVMRQNVKNMEKIFE
jgi:zinc transport system substrate-binding protein